MRIHPQVEIISSLAGNQYLLIDDFELALIDCGLKGNEKKILWRIESIGYQPAKLRRIYITHADADHYSAAAALKNACSANLFATKVEADAIRKGESSRSLRSNNLLLKLLLALVRVYFQPVPAEIDQAIAPDDTFPSMGGLQVLATPGHTPGHVSFYNAQNGILFAGDSIQIIHGTPAPSSGANTWDLERAIASFEKQMTLKPLMILAGHGKWVSKDINR